MGQGGSGRCSYIKFQICFRYPSSVPKMDIARFRHLFGPVRNNTPSEKKAALSLIHNVWRPSSQYKFPWRTIGGRRRRCQFEWIQKYPNLVYSHAEDALYCLPCTLFSGHTTKGGTATRGVLAAKPFRDWKDATEKFAAHFDGIRRYHSDSGIPFLAILVKH